MSYFSDLTHVEPGRRLDAAFDIVRAVSKVPFDVERGPLLRVDSFRLGPTRYVLYVTMHHMISDFRSLMTTVVRLLDYHSRIRRGESEIEPADVAPASAPVTSIENHTESLAFWKETLPGLDYTPLLFEPGDPPRPLRPSGSAKLTFTAELWKAINLRAPKVVTLAAYRLLLAELSGRRNFVIGMPMLRVSVAESVNDLAQVEQIAESAEIVATITGIAGRRSIGLLYVPVGPVGWNERSAAIR